MTLNCLRAPSGIARTSTAHDAISSLSWTRGAHGLCACGSCRSNPSYNPDPCPGEGRAPLVVDAEDAGGEGGRLGALGHGGVVQVARLAPRRRVLPQHRVLRRHRLQAPQHLRAPPRVERDVASDGARLTPKSWRETQLPLQRSTRQGGTKHLYIRYHNSAKAFKIMEPCA